MNRFKSIIYVNFAPYDNAGKILDYLITSFVLVIHFSFDFHKLNKKNASNIIRIYKNGVLIDTLPFIRIQTSEALLFISLPLRSLLIAVIILFYLNSLRKKYGIFHYYFTVNAYTSWIGNVCKSFGLVKKTVFWVWDYYPPGNSDWKMRFASFFYRKFDKLTASYSNKIVFLSKRLEELLRKNGGLLPSKQYEIIPIATDPKIHMTKKLKVIGHFGVLKKNQGLDYIFDTLELLLQKDKEVKLEIIGSGPDEDYFKAKAKMYGDTVTFYGYIENENKLEKLVSKWRVGLALYMPGENNVSYWTDPSKIKYYISQGVPTITTNVVSFAEEVTKYKAGIIVPYGDRKALLKAITEIIEKHNEYGKNASVLAEKYNYSILYPRFFNNFTKPPILHDKET